MSVGEIVFVLVATLLVLVALWWVIRVDHRFWRTNAGSAYLRIKGDDLAEQSPEDDGWDYVVPPARYLPAAKHDGQDRFEFRMPPIRASCGSSEATQRRAIGNWNKSSKDFGALGFVVSVAGDLADVPSFSANDYGAGGYGMHNPHKDPTGDAALDRALEDVQVPVCAAHVKAGSDPLRYDSGKLVFRSYRYYKEFLRLNKIDGAAEIKGSRAARR